MIKKITLKNYKSILDLELELGKFNVFIGENGSGKTNILEAVGMVAAAKNNRATIEDLANLGMRVAKPSLTFSSFLNLDQKNQFLSKFNFLTSDNQFENFEAKIINSNIDSAFYPSWRDEVTIEAAGNNLGMITDGATGWNDLMKLTQKKQSGELSEEKFKIELSQIQKQREHEQQFRDYLKDFAVYNLESQALRGITKTSLRTPLGIHGERLDSFLEDFSQEEFKKLLRFKYIVSWLDDIIVDKENEHKLKGLNMEGNSSLYFSDKFMKKGTLFNIENANEGILHILFYLALFISNKSPNFFAIDNIETALNPSLCRHLTEFLSTMNPNKQALITTHNPAILDGLDLTNDDIRLFAVRRTEKGYTACTRIKFKKGAEKKFKLSEMWMQGMLGAIPKNF